jgi:predicted Rossmann fold nucleotide-binding protein DprA/Smf involved in DNA uptake
VGRRVAIGARAVARHGEDTAFRRDDDRADRHFAAPGGLARGADGLAHQTLVRAPAAAFQVLSRLHVPHGLFQEATDKK